MMMMMMMMMMLRRRLRLRLRLRIEVSGAAAAAVLVLSSSRLFYSNQQQRRLMVHHPTIAIVHAHAATAFLASPTSTSSRRRSRQCFFGSSNKCWKRRRRYHHSYCASRLAQQSNSHATSSSPSRIRTVHGPFCVDKHLRVLDDQDDDNNNTITWWGGRGRGRGEPLLMRQAFPNHLELREAGTWPRSWDDILYLASHDGYYDSGGRNNTENEGEGGEDDDIDDDDDWVYENEAYFDSDDDSFAAAGESARLIQHVPGKEDSFTLELGPFDREYLDSLVIHHSTSPLLSASTSASPRTWEDASTRSRNRRNDKEENQAQQEQRSCWTLLVNDVDRYLHPKHSVWNNKYNAQHQPQPQDTSSRQEQQRHQQQQSQSLADWMDATFSSSSSSFLPRWRRDDAQVSIAPHGGGIGPHVDNYDVFLIQAMGRRSWKIAMNSSNSSTADDNVVRKLTLAEEYDSLVPDLPVRILKGMMTGQQDKGNDNPQHEVEEIFLEAGDVLYLPPRVIHWGTSLSDDCMTLSVGCRAPSAAELVSRVAEMTLSSAAMDTNEIVQQRYTDRSPTTTAAATDKKNEAVAMNDCSNEQDAMTTTAPATPAPSISNEVKEDLKNLVRQAMEQVLEDPFVWDEVVGKLVTEPKRLSSFHRREMIMPPEASLQLVDDDEDDNQDNNDDTARISSPLSIEMMLNRMSSSSSSSSSKMDGTMGGDGGWWSLVRTPGISFATSSVLADDDKNNETIHRLFANGEMYETSDTGSRDDDGNGVTATGIILSRIERGQPLRLQQHVAQTNKATREMLQQLLDDGFLYYD